MKRITLLFGGLLLVSILVGGCAAQAGNATFFWNSETELTQGNHEYVACGVQGAASCVYLLGIPLGDPDIHSAAQKKLGAAHKTKGEACAYVNVTQQDSVTDYFLVGVKRATLTADVIKFK